MLALNFAVLWALLSPPSPSGISRHDFFVVAEPGIRLFVREVLADAPKQNQPTAILVHGARVPGLASFDLDVPGGSLAADLTARGFVVYVMDVRGYGPSSRPPEMEQPPSAHPPLVRSNEAARDIGAVVDSICARRHVSRVALFGWATGGQWAGYYASLRPEKVSALILLNSLYGDSSQHSMLGHGSSMEDPNHKDRFNQADCGAYRLNSVESLFGVWDRSIPSQNKAAWRDPAIAEAYARAALSSDPQSNSHVPPSFRSPCGVLRTVFTSPSVGSSGTPHS